MSARDVAVANADEATKWVGSALAALNAVIGFGGKRSEIEGLSQFKALKTHFHVSLGPKPSIVDQLISMLPFADEADPTVRILVDIRSKYFQIATGLTRTSSFIDSPAEGEGKDASAFVPMVRDGTFRFTPNYLKVGPLNQVLVLVHEGAHFVSDAFQDYAYRDRTGEEDPNKYINLPVQYAIRNADSYAYFALQMAKGIDRILDLKE
jgi:hypothetical protein